MKAHVLCKQGPIEEMPLEFCDVEDPIPSSGEILIKVLSCGVCLTDRQIMEGDLPLKKSPIILGHQVVGEVAALGPGVTEFKEKDLVGMPWLHSTCQKCSFCKDGFENLCEKAQFSGYNVDGGYAEYTLCHQDFAIRVAKGRSAGKIAPLLCSGIVGYRSYKLANVSAGDRLGIYGFGSAAHIMMQVALKEGCEVFVFTRSEKHRKRAIELGATWAGGVEDIPPIKLDASISFAPVGEIVPIALTHLRRGGNLLLNAIHTTPISSFPYTSIYYEKSLKSVANATREDAQEFMRLVEKHHIEVEAHEYSLKDVLKAHADLKASKISGSAVLII